MCIFILYMYKILGVQNNLPVLQDLAFWFLEAFAKDAMIYMDYSVRKTVLPCDWLSPLKRQGRELVIFKITDEKFNFLKIT